MKKFDQGGAPHVASAHLTGHPAPLTSGRLLTPGYIAVLALLAVLVVTLNLTEEPVSLRCPAATAAQQQ